MSRIQIPCNKCRSLPSRERGLKYRPQQRNVMKLLVAPFTGAWIEISNRSLASLRATVAPFTGAWIEILPQARSRPVMSSLPSRERGLKSYKAFECRATMSGSLPSRERGLKYRGNRDRRGGNRSLPSRERGLKFDEQTGFLGVLDVAPFAGAWIEMAVVFGASCSLMSLPSRDRHR